MKKRPPISAASFIDCEQIDPWKEPSLTYSQLLRYICFLFDEAPGE